MLDGDNPKYTFNSCLQSFMSFNGYCSKFDCHRTLLSLNNQFYNLFHNEIEEYMIEQYHKKGTKFIRSKGFKVLYPLVRHKNPNAGIIVLYEK